MRKLPPLNALRSFEAAARHASLTLAAQELGVTHGAVSRQVHILEDFLGAPLFRRLHRRVELTDVGRAYLPEIGAALDRLSIATTAQLARREPRCVHINATPTFTLRWLIPRLPDFQQLYPGIEVRLATSNEPLDAIRAPFDLAIRRGSTKHIDFVSRWTLADDRAPVCCPTLAEREPITTLANLGSHVLLHAASRPPLWPDWLSAAGVPDLKPRGTLTFEHSFQALQAAQAGLGLAVGSLPLVADDIGAGRLLVPFDGPRLKIASYQAYVRRSTAGDAGPLSFCAWLKNLAVIGRAGPPDRA